jgi:hypothetical protein
MLIFRDQSGYIWILQLVVSVLAEMIYKIQLRKKFSQKVRNPEAENHGDKKKKM